MEAITPELTDDELYRITRYRRPMKQIEVLRQLGIPAFLRPDNTVLVLRMHMMQPTVQQTERPRLKLS